MNLIHWSIRYSLVNILGAAHFWRSYRLIPTVFTYKNSIQQAEREKNVKAIICCKNIEITDYYKKALEIRLIYIPDKMINYRFLVLLETLIILFSM